MKEITIQEGDKFIVTGLLYNSKKRFSNTYSTWSHARCINVWRGSKWLLRNGKRTLIERIWN